MSPKSKSERRQFTGYDACRRFSGIFNLQLVIEVSGFFKPTMHPSTFGIDGSSGREMGGRDRIFRNFNVLSQFTKGTNDDRYIDQRENDGQGCADGRNPLRTEALRECLKR